MTKSRPVTRAAIYVRVSTPIQSPQNQVRVLRQFCRHSGWVIVETYIEVASGTRPAGIARVRGCTFGRPVLAECMEAASRRRFDVLVFWSLDRLTREGALRSLELLERLTGYGVKYRSYTEPYIDATAPFAEAVIGLIAAIARAERERIRERVLAGLERARGDGIQLGKPRLVLDGRKMAEDAEAGQSYRQIAKRYGCSKATALRRIREWRQRFQLETKKRSKRNVGVPR